MKKHFYLLKTCLCALAVGVLAGCSAEGDDLQLADGMGAVKLSITANTGFDTMTKAITEADYTNYANYTVQIKDKDDRVVEGCEWTGDALPEEMVELKNGTYTLIAYTGEEYEGVGATTEGMYVAGKANINVNGGQTSATANCIPQCARMTVVFDEKMKDYFNDYYVEFTGTVALGQNKHTWAKDAKDPVYMAIEEDKTETVTATIKLVDKEGKVAEDIVKTYPVSAAKAVKMNIVPTVEGGSIGIVIEIDDSTNDVPVDIVIPGEWI